MATEMQEEYKMRLDVYGMRIELIKKLN